MFPAFQIQQWNSFAHLSSSRQLLHADIPIEGATLSLVYPNEVSNRKLNHVQGNDMIFIIDLNVWRRQNINFLEKIYLGSIDKVNKVSIFMNNNEILKIVKPFIVKDIDFKFPVAGHSIPYLELRITFDDLACLHTDVDHTLSYDFYYDICEFLQKTTLTSLMNETNDSREYSISLNTIIGKVTQIRVDSQGLKMNHVLIDHPCRYVLTWEKPDRCILKFYDPVDFKDYKNPLLFLRFDETETIDRNHNYIIAEITTMNSFSLLDNGAIGLNY